MPVRTTITLDIKAPNTLPRTRDEWPADRPSTRCRPRRTGGPGSPPSEPRPICLITDGDPSDGVSTQPRCPWGGGNRFCLSATSFITDLPRQATLFPRLSRRLARVPSAAARRGQAPIAGPLRAVLDPPIVIKKHRSSLSGNTVQPHVGVGGITAPFLHVPFLHVPRYGDIAPR
jgi:hypothetical protein